MNLSVSCSNDEADEQDGVLVLKKMDLIWHWPHIVRQDPFHSPFLLPVTSVYPHSSWHSKTGSQTKLDIPVSRTKEASILGHCLLLLSPAMQWITNKCLKILKTILPNTTLQHRSCSGVLVVYNVHKMFIFCFEELS